MINTGYLLFEYIKIYQLKTILVILDVIKKYYLFFNNTKKTCPVMIRVITGCNRL